MHLDTCRHRDVECEDDPRQRPGFCMLPKRCKLHGIIIQIDSDHLKESLAGLRAELLDYGVVLDDVGY